MNINWKDFGLMFVIAFLVFIIEFILGEFIWLLILLIPMVIPFIFYFYKNKVELKEAAVISIIFTTLFLILFWFFVFIINPGILEVLCSFISYQVYVGTWGYLAVFAMIASALIFTLIISLTGLIIWFAVKKLKRK